jgi:tRNA threonylcarbamoyladenosine biosynthesis protein TsaB
LPLRILALETSTDRCSVALMQGTDLRSRGTAAGQAHSDHVLPLIDALLAEAQIRLSALDAIAFGCGPGSFTGLRVACGVAQGLAFGAELPVVPVESLAAVAYQAWRASGAGTQPVAVLLDARMQELYAGLYRLREEGGGAHADSLGGPALLAQADAARWLREAGWNGQVAAGDGLTVGEGVAAATGLAHIGPTADAVARLAAGRFAAQGGVAPEAASPLYVRDKVAFTSAERAVRAAQGLATGNPAAREMPA